MGMGEVPPPVRRENGRRRRRWADDGDGDDYDDEDFVAEEEEEEEEELPASSAGEDGEDSDAEYQGEDDEEEEEEEETPWPKRPGKGGARGRKGKRDPSTARAKRRRYDVDDDYEEEPNEEDEIEEYDEDQETPRPVKGGTWGRKRKADPATARARRRRYDVDEDYEEEPDEDEELEPDDDEEAEEYHEEIEEEEEEAPSQPKSTPKCARRGQNVEPVRSSRRKYEDEDMDFEPELDGDEEEEVDEDIDFDPEVDDEDEFEDEEEEEFSAARVARKVTAKNPAKRKSVSKRRSLKKKKSSKGSKASKRKKGSTKARKSAPVRRVRKRFVVGDSDKDSEDDDDFIVDDPVEVNRHPRKKARTGTSKRTELEHPSVEEEEAWPNVESETSEFEFVTSDDEPDDAGTVVAEDSSTKKRRKKRRYMSESSSDSEFVLSDKELENLGPAELPKPLPVLTAPIRKISIITRHGEDKGKEKEEPEEAGKPICGICLSEEQRATVQGVLNCCSHYFCFACIMEWSRVESRCPLCKQRFTTITKSSKADLGLGLRKAVIKVEERDQVYQPTEEEIRRWLDPYENVVCIECNQGGDDSLMLLCDICDSSAHTYCVGLGREVPEGNWYCGGCRLNDEGPSHARMPHTVGYERQSSRNHVDFSSVGFGVAAQNGTYDRSSSINRHSSFQGIDLNLSPREAPGETHLVESQASTDSVSTPTGRRATVSGRRQIHRYIRILLSQPRQVTTTRQDMLPSFVPRNGAEPRTELNRHSFRSPSEGTTAQIPDGIQNQNDGLAFAPSMSLDGDDFHHIEGVKSNLRNMQ